MKPEVKTILKYTIAALVGGIVAYIVTRTYGLANAETLQDKYKILSDAFTIPAVLLLMNGLLFWVVRQGALDSIAYALKYGLRTLLPGGGLKSEEKYYDYVMRKREERAETKGSGRFLFIVGGVFAIVAAVFIILFYREYNLNIAGGIESCWI